MPQGFFETATMRDGRATPAGVPLDQADGLRRLFAGRGQQVLALAANPHVPFGGLVLDRVAAALAALGRTVLVVDAAATAPPAHELTRLDLAVGIERLTPAVSYLPARGLPTLYVDTRGSADAFIDALQQAATDADVVLLHAEGPDLARMLGRRELRPLLMGADHPESLKHAYASCKLLVRRCGLMSFDLLLAASSLSPRVAAIAASLRSCADTFLGAVLRDWTLIDPAGDAGHAPGTPLARLLAAQLELDTAVAPPAWAAATGSAVDADPTPHRHAIR